MARSAEMGVLLDHAQDKVALLDGTGEFTYVNDASWRILGYRPSELVGTNAFDYVHPEDADGVRSAFERTIDSDGFTVATVEYRFRASDGSWVHLESRMSNLTDEELDGYVVSSRNVTDRVTAERGQHETAARLKELAAASGDVLWMFDGDWSELLFMNPAYEEIYGQPVGHVEADPRAFLEAVHPDDVPAVEEAMAHLTDGQPVDVEFRVNPEADYGVWVWVQANPIVQDDEVVRITGSTRDVTDRRRRERQLFVMDNLLRHNLRNDLTLVLGQAELIEEEVPEVADRTAVIRRTGEDLLASAEKEREIIDLLTGEGSPEPLDVVAVVEDAVETVRERYPGAEVTVSTPETATATALAELRIAVVELLENAVRHGGSDRPSVGVTVTAGDDEVRVAVDDEATPIPEIEAGVLAGDYEMSDVYHSSGLGLWLVHWVVELSDGTITVESGPGVGNRVTVELPRRP